MNTNTHTRPECGGPSVCNQCKEMQKLLGASSQTETDELDTILSELAKWWNGRAGDKEGMSPSEAKAALRRYSHHQTEQVLDAELRRWKGWLSYVETGGGHINRTQIRETIGEIDAELERLKEQSLPTNKDKEEL